VTAAQWAARLRDWVSGEAHAKDKHRVRMWPMTYAECRELAALLDAAGERAEALMLIEKWGGHADIESGLSCNGSWCAEQARTALAKFGAAK